MGLSPEDSLILVGLLAAASALLAFADLIRVPYPIPLVLGGLGLGFVPEVPRIELPPCFIRRRSRAASRPRRRCAGPA